MIELNKLEKKSPLRIEEIVRQNSSLPILLGESISEIGSVDHIKLDKIKEEANDRAKEKIESIESFAQAVHRIFNPKSFTRVKSIPIENIVSHLEKFEEWVERYGEQLHQYPFQKQFFYNAVSLSLEKHRPEDNAILNILPVLFPKEIKKYCQYEDNFQRIQQNLFFKKIWATINDRAVVESYLKGVEVKKSQKRTESRIINGVRVTVVKDEIDNSEVLADTQSIVSEQEFIAILHQNSTAKLSENEVRINFNQGNQQEARANFEKQLNELRDQARKTFEDVSRKRVEGIVQSVKMLSKRIEEEKSKENQIVNMPFSEHIREKFGKDFLLLLYGVRESQKRQEVSIGDFVKGICSLEEKHLKNLEYVAPVAPLQLEEAIHIHSSDVSGTMFWQGLKEVIDKPDSEKNIISDLLQKSIKISPDMPTSEKDRLFCQVVNGNTFITKDKEKLKFRRELFQHFGLELVSYTLIGEIVEEKIKESVRPVLMPAQRIENGFQARLDGNYQEFTEASFYEAINHPLKEFIKEEQVRGDKQKQKLLTREIEIRTRNGYDTSNINLK